MSRMLTLNICEMFTNYLIDQKLIDYSVIRMELLGDEWSSFSHSFCRIRRIWNEVLDYIENRDCHMSDSASNLLPEKAFQIYELGKPKWIVLDSRCETVFLWVYLRVACFFHNSALLAHKFDTLWVTINYSNHPIQTKEYLHSSVFSIDSSFGCFYADYSIWCYIIRKDLACSTHDINIFHNSFVQWTSIF